jgi:hypothetical protein
VHPLPYGAYCGTAEAFMLKHSDASPGPCYHCKLEYGSHAYYYSHCRTSMPAKNKRSRLSSLSPTVIDNYGTYRYTSIDEQDSSIGHVQLPTTDRSRLESRGKIYQLISHDS